MRSHSEWFPEALLSLLYVPGHVDFNSPAVSCDCLAHVYGNAADHPDRVRRYPSDMTDAEWAAVRPLLPVPAWFQGRGGRPYGSRESVVSSLGGEGHRRCNPSCYPLIRASMISRVQARARFAGLCCQCPSLGSS